MKPQTGMAPTKGHFKKPSPDVWTESAPGAGFPVATPHQVSPNVPLIPSDAAVVRLSVRSRPEPRAAALVYVFEADHGVKVGMTISSADERRRELERASGLHIEVVGAWLLSTRARARSVEADAHWILRETRTRGEWFQCHPLEAVEAVEKAIRRGDCAPLRMLAEIREAAA